MADVRCERARRVFGKVVALDDIDLEVADHEFVVLVGPSGCGKTTLLRCFAGLERLDGGRVLIGGRDSTDLPPRARHIAMVFQSYAIFPHMKVFDNIAFGLRMQQVSQAETKRQVDTFAELLDIGRLLDRYPSQISGGQRQRVAVARALATKADVLLMDEPLSNLDALLRLQMRAELKALLHNVGTTTIYVTHDQVEALSMGDRVAVMKDGRIVQIDTPLRVYDRPNSTYVGGFVGSPPMNFLQADVQDAGRDRLIKLSGGSLRWPTAEMPSRVRGRVRLGIRAEAISINSSSGPNLVTARVVVTEPLGSHNLVTLKNGEETFKVSTGPHVQLPPGSEVWVAFDIQRVCWMDRETGEAIADDPLENAGSHDHSEATRPIPGAAGS